MDLLNPRSRKGSAGSNPAPSARAAYPWDDTDTQPLKRQLVSYIKTQEKMRKVLTCPLLVAIRTLGSVGVLPSAALTASSNKS